MALILRETKGTPLSFGEMDGNLTYLEGLAQQGGDPFPYTGDALIDGTLNIDFTETLEWATLRDLEIEGGEPIMGGGLITGNGIGVKFSNGDVEGYQGFIDGQVSLEQGEEDPPFVIPGYFWFNYQKTTDTVINSLQGVFSAGSGDVIIQRPVYMRYNDGEDEYEHLIESIQGFGDTNLIISSRANDNLTEIRMGSEQEGIRVRSNSYDDVEIFGIEGLSQLLFLIRSTGIFLPNLPTVDPEEENQLWVDSNGFLKVSPGV
jgi:hypothetical protein